MSCHFRLNAAAVYPSQSTTPSCSSSSSYSVAAMQHHSVTIKHTHTPLLDTHSQHSNLPVVKFIDFGQVPKQHISFVLQGGRDEVAEL